MKGLIIKDFLNLKKNIRMLLITIIIYTLFFISYDPTFLCGIMTMLFSIQSLSTFSYDEHANWDTYALSLPISRKILVLSKYVVFALFPISGAIISMILTFIVCLFKGPIQLNVLFSAGIACLLAAELLVFILLPFIFKFGVERGRIIMMVISFSIFGVILLSNKFLGAIFTSDLSTKINVLLPFLPWIGLTIVLIIAYLSYQLSLRTILKKEY